MENIVWLLKSDGSGSDYQETIANQGFQIEVIPTLTFETVGAEVLMDEANNPSKYSGIIFTSIRAVESFGKVFSKIPLINHSEWSSKFIFAVGHGTANAIEKNLNLSCIGKDSNNAQQLITVILQNTKPFEKPLLFPCGNLRRDELPSLLASNDRDFRAITCYVTSQHPELESSLRTLMSKSKPNYIVFFSPSGVNYAVPLMNQLFPKDFLIGIKCIAIGPSTNAALVKYDIPVFGSCSEPSPTGVLQLLK